MSASTKVDPQMVLDLLNAADCDEWKDPSVREMFRLVALGFRQVLAERDELRAEVEKWKRYNAPAVRLIGEAGERADKAEGERDAIKAEAVRLSEVVNSLCSDELAAALLAWRGLTEERREIVSSWIAGSCGASPEAMRLLKAAGR